MGVGSGLYMYITCRRKTFTFAVSSSDEFLLQLLSGGEGRSGTMGGRSPRCFFEFYLREAVSQT